LRWCDHRGNRAERGVSDVLESAEGEEQDGRRESGEPQRLHGRLDEPVLLVGAEFARIADHAASDDPREHTGEVGEDAAERNIQDVEARVTNSVDGSSIELDAKGRRQNQDRDDARDDPGTHDQAEARFTQAFPVHAQQERTAASARCAAESAREFEVGVRHPDVLRRGGCPLAVRIHHFAAPPWAITSPLTLARVPSWRISHIRGTRHAPNRLDGR
jgi:hypothetical protein